MSTPLDKPLDGSKSVTTSNPTMAFSVGANTAAAALSGVAATATAAEHQRPSTDIKGPAEVLGIANTPNSMPASAVLSGNSKIPITIFAIGLQHVTSAVKEKTLEEIMRLKGAGIDISVGLELPHDFDCAADALKFFKTHYYNDIKVELTAQKVLEFCCSIGPNVTAAQYTEFFYKHCKYANDVIETSPYFLSSIAAMVFQCTNDLPDMYKLLSKQRSNNILRYLKNVKIPFVGIDLEQAPLRAVRIKSDQLLAKGEHNEALQLILALEDKRLQEMSSGLSRIITQMPKAGGVIFVLDLGIAHLQRLGAWMLREQRDNPALKDYDIQLKLIQGSSNRKIFSKNGFDLSVGQRQVKAESDKTDSAEIKALYDQVPCHNLVFRKNEAGPNFEVECPEFSQMITQAIARHKVKPQAVGTPAFTPAMAAAAATSIPVLAAAAVTPMASSAPHSHQ